jgi:hypothetical protein
LVPLTLAAAGLAALTALTAAGLTRLLRLVAALLLRAGAPRGFLLRLALAVVALLLAAFVLLPAFVSGLVLTGHGFLLR